eukprot:CAMPEP_0170749562 /NCGR_PEP_ID=MMETSP0437-20130122/10458_1 /TAXON_ID=0 /ORGANISM="Sexangularia sp." /LENGTH=314 /DNA_ID=CAMNT_0011088487 /DNA_START=29 /DNA_END=973 /DNA_ORIENTATION=+
MSEPYFLETPYDPPNECKDLLAKLSFVEGSTDVVKEGSVRRIVSRPDERGKLKIGIWTETVSESVKKGPITFGRAPTGKRDLKAGAKSVGIERIPADGTRRYKVFLADVTHGSDESEMAWKKLLAQYPVDERPAFDHRLYGEEENALIERYAKELETTERLCVAVRVDQARVKAEILRRIALMVELMPPPFVDKCPGALRSKKAHKMRRRRDAAVRAFERAIGDPSVSVSCETGKAENLRQWVRAHGSERGKCPENARLFDVFRHARHVMNHPTDDFVRRDDELLERLTALFGGQLEKTRRVLVTVYEALLHSK